MLTAQVVKLPATSVVKNRTSCRLVLSLLTTPTATATSISQSKPLVFQPWSQIMASSTQQIQVDKSFAQSSRAIPKRNFGSGSLQTRQYSITTVLMVSSGHQMAHRSSTITLVALTIVVSLALRSPHQTQM